MPGCDDTTVKAVTLLECLEDRPFIAKLWGMEEVLVNNSKYCSKLLWITPGMQCSLHYHEVKEETFVAMDGLTRVEYWVDGKRFDTVLVGYQRDVLNIPPKVAHRFWSMGAAGSLLLEVSSHHDDEDVVRLEPSREIDSKGLLEK